MEDKYYRTYQAEDVIAFGMMISGILFLVPATVIVGWYFSLVYEQKGWESIIVIFLSIMFIFGLIIFWGQLILTFFTGLYIEIEGERIRTWNVLKRKLCDIDLKEVEKIYSSNWVGQKILKTKNKKYLVHFPTEGYVEAVEYVITKAVNCKYVCKRTYELLEKHRRGKL
ncbi:MAG: hypothetical protein KAZ87_04860 [Spirochaetes bacterium]|nr:hypothetical protein [Spirochaetota bacterium]